MSVQQTRISSTATAPLWRDPDLLEKLYWEDELSLSEIAGRLGCHKSTVERWADRYGMELRPANDQKRQPSIWTNERGYTYAESTTNGHRGLVAIHELGAIHAGADPHDVFSPETEIHHRMAMPGGFDAPKLDVPGDVTVMDSHDHQVGHREDALERPPLEAILGAHDEG